MLIPNSLRMEYMPKMVYAIVRLVGSGQYTADELRKRITASVTRNYDDSSNDRFGMLLTFALDGGFIREKNGYFETEFTDEELESFPEFTYALLGKLIIQNNNMFDAMLKYYLSSDQTIEGDYTGTAAKFREKSLEDPKVKSFRIEEDNVHGFFFWVEALGIATFESYRSGHLYFCVEELLLRCINKHPEFKNLGSMPTKQFLDLIQRDLYFIPFCCADDGNVIMYPLSQALRILDNMGVIALENRQDSDQMWHLPSSRVFSKNNTFTNVRVC